VFFNDSSHIVKQSAYAIDDSNGFGITGTAKASLGQLVIRIAFKVIKVVAKRVVDCVPAIKGLCVNLAPGIYGNHGHIDD
jgi:hypothetical protein